MIKKDKWLPSFFLSSFAELLLIYMSKSEEKIASLLINAGYKFEREKIFLDLRNGKLRFDFYIPSKSILIEVDGEQHFKRVTKFHPTQQDFTHAKQNDYYKNSYALAHNLTLYRIPFWEINNVSTALDIFSSKYRVTSKWHNDIIYREYLKSQS